MGIFWVFVFLQKIVRSKNFSWQKKIFWGVGGYFLFFPIVFYMSYFPIFSEVVSNDWGIKLLVHHSHLEEIQP